MADKKGGAKRIWNKIPEEVKERVVDMALSNPEKSCRQITWKFVDQEGVFSLGIERLSHPEELRSGAEPDV